MALKLSDYVVTEAGFGADLGAEKFLDIKCRKTGLRPDAVVIVATVKALKYNVVLRKRIFLKKILKLLKQESLILDKHIENMQNFGLNVVVTLNAFATDTEVEHNFIKEHVEGMGCEFALARVWEKGGEGGIELANKVLKAIEKEQKPFTLTYSDDMGLKDKVKAIATKIYGAKDVSFAPAASKMLDKIEKWICKFPCMYGKDTVFTFR